MIQSSTVGLRLLAVIAVLLGVAALKWSYPVTMPLTAAIVVVAAAWPIKPWLDRMLPSKLSYVGTILILATFAAAIYFSISRVFQAFAERQGEFKQLNDTYTGWAGKRGLPVLGSDVGSGQFLGVAQMVLAPIYETLTYLGIVAVLVILALPEVPALRDKVRERLHGGERRELIGTAGEIAGKVRDYLWTMTLMSLITGAACWLLAVAVGLDLALVWGLLNFLLNYIPLIGNVIGIVPPALYAAIQFQNWQTPLLVFLGYAALQAVVGNILAPVIQGRSLSLSPVAVVIALAFWGWVWGIPGTLLAVPLTAALVIICQHFRSTEWIAALLSGRK